jgi:hypothetical protein
MIWNIPMLTINKKSIIPFLALAVMLSCLSAAEIQGTISANGEPLHRIRSFTVTSPGISPPLDEKTYESRIIHYLTDKGLTYAPNDPSAVRVTYSYSIDKGRPGTIAEPVYGSNGFLSFGYGGFHRHHGGYGGSIGVPTYGVVGAVPQPVTIYTRELTLNFISPRGALLQQMNLVSPGLEGDLRYVMPALIHAAIKKFPMEPGQRKDVSADIE